jgi:hypothetical protein
VFWDELFFGTAPDPPLVPGFTMETIPQPYDPGPLAPGTTYYWKIKRVDTDIGTVESPVWQFTTEGPTSVDASTWGNIKAVYDE